VEATATGDAAHGAPEPPALDRTLVALLVVTTGLGAVLRLHGLGNQILLGDELFTLWAISLNDLASLPASVGRFDHSIPLSMLFALVGQVVALDETIIRAPFVICGLALPPLATLGARRFVDRDTAIVLGLLVAVHPLFVFYTRFARPYGIDALLIGAMIVLLDRARSEGSTKRLVQAAALGALAAWLHLLALMTAGLLFAGALAGALLDDRDPPSPTDGPARAPRVAAAGLACLVVVALLYLPAVEGLTQHVFGDKIGSTPLTWRAVGATLPLVAGLHGWGTGLLFVALGLAGLALLGFELGRRSLVLLVPALAHPLLVGLLEPTKVSYGPVFARYLIFVLPIWLLGIARLTMLSARRVARASGAERRPSGALAGLLLASTLLVAGPWTTTYAEPTSFAHSNYFQGRGYLDGGDSFFAWPPRWVARPHPTAVHPVYAKLALEAPVVVEWLPSNDSHYFALAQAQMVHRRPVKILPFRNFGDRFALRHELSVESDLEALPGGTVVIVHRPRPNGPGRVRFAALSARVRRTLGPPVLDDDRVVAFVIARRPSSGARPE
jgi:hypothetical protein